MATSGISAAVKTGWYSGATASGVEGSLRLETLEIVGSVVQADEDRKEKIQSRSDFFSFENTNISVNKADIQLVGANLGLRFHPMNGSFFFGFLAGQTIAKGTLDVDSELSSEKIDEVRTITRQTFTVAVGNIWTPGGILIGAQWIGGVRSLSEKKEIKSNSSEISETDMIDASDKFQDELNLMGHGGTVNLLMVSFGVMLGV